MTVPRLDALFHWPRAVRVILQKFFVVIGLDHQGLHLAQPFDDQFGHVTEIGDEPEAALTGVEDKAERIHSIVRHGKRLHGDVANRKHGTVLTDSLITTSFTEYD